MAKASPAQVSFNGGEWSSRLDGRVDLAKYGNACHRIRNFLPTVQGPAIKRSGTRFVKEVKNSAAATRLIPFEFGTTQAYILEFGNLYCRVYKDSGGVLEATVAISSVSNATPIVITTGAAHQYADDEQVFVSGSAVTGINSCYFKINVLTPTTFELVGTAASGAGGAVGTVARCYEFVTPYATADLSRIQYAQSADVLYIAHPDHPPAKISRTGHTAWTHAEIEWDVPPFRQQNLDQNEYLAFQSFQGGAVDVYSTGGRFTANHVGSMWAMFENIEGSYPEWVPGTNPATADGNTWSVYQVGASNFKTGENIYAHYSGRVYKFTDDNGGGRSGSAPPIHEVGIQSDGQWDWSFYNHGYGWLEIDTVTDAYKAVASGGVVGGTPDTDPLGRTCFYSGEESITDITDTGADTVITISGAHTYQPGDKVFLYNTAIAALNNIIWTISSVGAGTFNLGSGGYGSNPANQGNSVLVKQNATTYATPQRRPILYRFAEGAFSDAAGYPTAVAFFEDRLWWAGTASDPQGLWASRVGRYEDHLLTDEDDGALFLLLNSQEVNRIEWISSQKRLIIGTAGSEFVLEPASPGPITAGNVVASEQTHFGSRASVPPARIESRTLFVQRSGRKLLDFGYDDASDNYQGTDLGVLSHHLLIPRIAGMAWAQEPDRVLWVYCEDGTLAGLTYDRAQDVIGWHPQELGGTGVSVESIAVIPHPDGDRDQVWMVVARTVNAATVRYVEYLEETWIKDTALEDGFFVDSGATYDSVPATTIYGLWHLKSESVVALADGVAVEGLTVSSTGTITLSTAASVVQVGLAYDAEIETMRLEAGGADGTAQGKTKRITNVVLRIEDTGAGLYYSPDLDEYAIDPGDLETGDTRILPWSDGYNQEARINLSHTKPTPCTIVAIFPQVVTEDR